MTVNVLPWGPNLSSQRPRGKLNDSKKTLQGHKFQQFLSNISLQTKHSFTPQFPHLWNKKFGPDQISASQSKTMKLSAQNHLKFLFKLQTSQVNLKNILREKIKHKRLHAAWLHLYEIPEKAKLQERKQALGCLMVEGKGGERKWIAKGHKKTLWVMQLFYIGIAVGATWLYTIIKIHQTHVSGFYGM